MTGAQADRHQYSEAVSCTAVQASERTVGAQADRDGTCNVISLERPGQAAQDREEESFLSVDSKSGHGAPWQPPKAYPPITIIGIVHMFATCCVSVSRLHIVTGSRSH